jgi:hypothetical protein
MFVDDIDYCLWYSRLFPPSQGESTNRTIFNMGGPGGQDFNFNPNDSKDNYNIVPWWRYLLGYRLHHSVIRTPFIADYTVGLTIALLQTVLSLTVLSIHTFRRLSWPSTISVGARLFTVDSRLSLPLLSPTTLLALTGWLSRLTDFSLRNSCLKVGEGERYSRHLPQLFIYAL